MVNQVKLCSFHMMPIYQYGYLVPNNHDQALEINQKNGDTKLQDAEKLGLKQLDWFKTFLDLGKDKQPSHDYKMIQV